jgi:L-iditol 2-dehydrogenase
MGLLHLQLSKNLLGARTVVIGKTPERMATAKSFGADKVFSADNHQVSEILQSNGRSGHDLIVVATSEPSALDLAAKIASKGSCINVFAGIKGTSGALDPNLIHYNQISVNGSFSSTPDNFRRAVQLASSKIVDLSKMVTHRYSLDAISEAISVTESYKGLRAAVSP